MGLSELRSTLWTRLYLAELRCTLVSYTALIGAAPHTYELCCTLVSYAAPFWATLHPTELGCPLLTYAATYWADLHPSELPCTLRARLYHAELLCTLTNYAAPLWATLYYSELLCTPSGNYTLTSITSKFITKLFGLICCYDPCFFSEKLMLVEWKYFSVSKIQI
jgi:hypothetical protein